MLKVKKYLAPPLKVYGEKKEIAFLPNQVS